MAAAIFPNMSEEAKLLEHRDALPNVPAWGSGETPLTLPHVEGDVTSDICVVGLGGSGLTCIHELLSLGAHVVGVDATTVGGGAAGRNGGFLLAGAAPFHHDAVASIGRERASALYHLTLEEMDRIASEPSARVRRTGSLRIAASDEELADCRLQFAAMQLDGLDVEWYEGTEGTGLLLPHDGVFDPLVRCRALARIAIAGGVRLFENSRAISIEPGLVTTPAGRVHCDVVIVAVDGALDVIFPELRDQVRTARLQMLATAPLSALHFQRPVYSRWGYDYWQQLEDGRLFMGGCRDRAERAEWTHDSSPSQAVQGCLDRLLRDTLGVREPVTHRWAASVGYTPDEMPLVAEPRARVWAAGGYNGTGNVIGTLCGRMLAQLAVTGASTLTRALAPSIS